MEDDDAEAELDLLEILKNRVYHLEGLIDFLANLRTSQDNLAADEDQVYNLGLDHTIDQSRKQLGFVRTEVVMARGQTLETDWELNVAGANNVLDLEVCELRVEA